MPTISKSASYNAGKADALAGRPRDATGHSVKNKYHDGYSRYKDRAVKVHTKDVKPIKDTRRYDWANDKYFDSDEAMDAAHGILVME